LLRLGLGGCALLPLLAQAAAQIGAPAPVKAPPDPTPILLQADEIVYDEDKKMVSAVGHVEIADQGRTLIAERVEYDQASDKVTARGHVSLTDARGNVAFADHVVLSDHMRDGVLQGFGALIGKSGRLAAQDTERVNGNTVIAHRAVYSPCIICNKPGATRTPLWQVKAERIVYDQNRHNVRFTNATIDIKGVPVAWVPAFSVPDPSVKYATGLLTPEVGNSTKIGYFLRQPVYVAISSSQDLTLAPMVSTTGGEVLEAEYRMRWNNGGMWFQGSGAYNPKGGLSGSPGAQTYGHLFGSGRVGLGDFSRIGFDIQTTSNNGYMRFYDISFLDRLVNDLFVEATPGRSRMALSSYYFQGLRSTDVTSRIPYVLPKLEFSYIPVAKVAGGSLRFDVNGIAIGRDNGRNDQRLTSEINWKIPTVFGNGQLWTFVLDARGDGYHFDVPRGTIATTNSMIERGTAYAALDWRWPFLSQGGGGRSYILQPVAQVIAQPYGGNPTGLRIEDAQDFEFDENNLFTVNQVPGYDLIESGPRANVGFMAEALLPGGKIEAQAGQTYRLKPDPKFTAFSGNSGTASDLVGSVSLKFPNLDITDRIDIDRGNGNVRRHELYVTGSYHRSSLQISYVQLPTSVVNLGLPSREQVNAQADLNLFDNWQIFVAGQRDLHANQFLNTEFGLGYEDECLAISLAYRRKYTQDLLLGVPPSTSVILRFSLKTGDEGIQPFSLFPKDVFALTHP
jgi:LPS-assembly protein